MKAPAVLFLLLLPVVVRAQAPPPAPPVVTRPRTEVKRPSGPVLQGTTLYSIGQPTDEEQLSLEFINRSRADANAEALRHKTTTDSDVLGAYAFFGVDLDEMTNQFAQLEQHVAPLAMNSNLLVAARLHSLDMFTNVFQGHFSSTNPPSPNDPGDHPTNRLIRQGYSYWTMSENVYAYAKSTYHAHAGLDVDWGTDSYGMQVPPGHRYNIHSNAFREVGVGIVLGSNSNATEEVGPMIITQDFGTQQADTPFILGAAYYDLNTNQFYDLGEGLGGVMVQVDGTEFYAVTAESGGYTVPVTSNGSYRITFSGTNLTTLVTTGVVADAENVKVDFVPPYTAPVVSGETTAATGTTYTYTFPSVGGVTNYRLRVYHLSTNTWTEGAEEGTNNVIVDASELYSVIIEVPAPVSEGAKAFHLTHTQAVDQTITPVSSFYVGSNAQLFFDSQLGYATAVQIARVKVSVDGGSTWQNVYSQPGDGMSGESVFTTHNVSLASSANCVVLLRFSYDKEPGPWYPQAYTSPLVGWAFDNVIGSNLLEVTSVSSNNLGGNTSFQFTPSERGIYLPQVRGEREGRTFPYASWLHVDAGSPTLSLSITNMSFQAGGTQLRIVFQAEHELPTSTGLRSAESAMDTLTNIPGLTATDLGGGSYEYVYTLDGATGRVFRVYGTAP